MKLRRVVTAAAATAAIAPAALIGAPSAFAEESPAAGAASATATSEPASSPTDSPGAATTAPPAAEPSAPAPDQPGGGASSGAPAASAPARSAATSSGAPASPSAPASATSSSPSGDVTEPPVDEDCIDAPQVSLAGFPSKFVAGAGWSNFTLTMKNATDKAFEDVYPWIGVASVEPGLSEGEAHLEYYNPLAKSWLRVHNVVEEGGYIGDGYTISMGPKDVLDIKLRLRFDKGAPVGEGISLTTAEFYNADGSCGYSESDLYWFEIVAAGTKPGGVHDVEPQEGGRKPITTKPRGGTEKIPVTGSLASTGSSSALPMIGAIGGAAVALGAGTVFVVRRRRAAGAGETTAV